MIDEPRCPECGYPVDDGECVECEWRESSRTSPAFGSAEHVAALRKGIEVAQSGWGGCMPDGRIVDRREHPEAVPIAKNTLLGVPQPNAPHEPLPKVDNRKDTGQ